MSELNWSNPNGDEFESSNILQMLETEEEFLGDDIIDNVHAIPHEYDDCYFTTEEYVQVQTPSTQKWKDYDVKNNEVIFSIDESKKRSWDLAKEEVKHVQFIMCQLSGKKEGEELDDLDILELTFGKDSQIMEILKTELNLEHSTIIRFISTLTLQAAYRVTVT